MGRLWARAQASSNHYSLVRPFFITKTKYQDQKVLLRYLLESSCLLMKIFWSIPVNEGSKVAQIKTLFWGNALLQIMVSNNYANMWICCMFNFIRVYLFFTYLTDLKYVMGFAFLQVILGSGFQPFPNFNFSFQYFLWMYKNVFKILLSTTVLARLYALVK